MDYIVDHIGGYTLRHWLAFAGRKRRFSEISRETNVADEIKKTGGGCSLLRTPLGGNSPVIWEKKYKIERKNRGRRQFFPSSPGFKRVGK